jgi:glycosyltransferase involved in cell wall biosynthesis
VVPLEQTRVAAIGVAEEFAPEGDPSADCEAARLVDAPGGALEILHVGSTIPRKRIDLLLRIVAELRRRVPAVHLVRAGGPFTAEQERLAHELGLEGHLSVLPPVSDRVLAGVYRRAALVVLPSDREGFGLPVVESMACGTPVVASDLAALHEVGGGAVTYCTGSDPVKWADAIDALIREREEQPRRWTARRSDGIAAAHRFTWSAFAEKLVSIYEDVARGRQRVPQESPDPCPA